MLGKILQGRYHLIQELGSGGFGKTYLAEDRLLPGHPQCVVKQLQPQSNQSFILQTAKRLFEREAKILQQLGAHDRIPRLMAHFEENQEFYLVQELILGNELSREITTGKQFSEAEVIALLQDILEVLAFVHQEQVIHRDIKPANLIRRSSDGKIVLIDFGAVKEIRNLTVSSQGSYTSTVAIGTRGYMPDEQANGQPKFSSDVYAVGIIGIEALTGLDANPNSGGLPVDAVTGEIVWRDRTRVSDAFANVLDTMVRKDCRQRYLSAVEALGALQNLSQPRANPTVASPAVSPPPPTTQPSQPSRSSVINFTPDRNLHILVGLLTVFVTILVSLMAFFQKEIRERFGLDSPLLTYEEPNYGIKIKYPQNWIKEDKANPIVGTVVTFVSPKEGDRDTFQENLSIEVEDLAGRSLTEEEYKKAVVNQIYKLTNKANIIIESSQEKMGNSLGNLVVYTEKDGELSLKRMQMWTLKNNKAYAITYEAEEAKYLNFKPTAEKMIESLEIR